MQGLSLSTIAMHDNTYNLIYWDYCENPGNTIDETVTVNGRPVIYRKSVSGGETIDATSNAGAIICVNSTDITIRDTTTEAMGDGITLLFCRDVCVENVTADKIFSDSVWASSSENISVHDSSFGPDIYHGIFAEGTNGLQAAGNNFAYRYGGAGVSLIRVNDTLITNNTMSGDEDCMGVMGNETSGLIVAGNTIEGGTGYGIDIINADMITVSDNTMDVTKYGIQIQNGEMITVSGNTVQCNDIGGVGMLMFMADGADIVGNTMENCSMQAGMILNNSVVRDNHFSGAAYPLVLARDVEEDVYVYRNDFVLTEGHAGLDAAVLHTTANEAWLDNTEWGGEAVVQVGIPNRADTGDRHADMAFASLTADSSARMDGGEMIFMYSPVWHSPTEETYWYYGRAFTQTMGNYWSTYNGTDTTHDASGGRRHSQFPENRRISTR
ncbi:right-handed parallel beta-helix repeat-containing protein [Methanogenium cariaci]|uniref:NosD domain-containing protein n=1 Tax=Methanogenium cariaci TaxID=2197 RepID=UPI00155DCC6C|nr:right-handed parallel beta-helix repeat-containing protein [Methanogenium cariaci]